MRNTVITKVFCLVFVIMFSAAFANGAIEVHLLNPPDGATDIELPAVLEFTVSDTYVQYEIIIDDNADFSSPEVIIHAEGYFTSNTIDTVFGLAEETTYYWFVNAFTMSYTWMKSIETWHFTTEGCLIESPLPLMPDDGVINAVQPVYLEWEEVSNAIEYQVQVDDNDDFSSPEYDFNLPGTGTCVFFLEDDRTYYWRVKAIKDECISDWSEVRSFTTDGHTGVKEIESSGLPRDFRLYQNYPNPFNPRTTILFSIPREQFVTIEIYNALGEKVETILSERFSAGYWPVIWDGDRYSSGIYYYRIITDEFIDNKKMVLIK